MKHEASMCLHLQCKSSQKDILVLLKLAVVGVFMQQFDTFAIMMISPQTLLIKS